MSKAARRFAMRAASAAPKRDWFKLEVERDDEGKEQSGKLYLYEEIGYWGTTAADFASQLDALDLDELEVHVNSPGGDIFDGVAIYNAIKNHQATVTVYVDGLAASAASFIACAGDRIIMGRSATMMIHDGWGMCIGNEADMLRTAGVLSQLSDNIAAIYADEAGGEQKEWRELMRAEVWYTAEEAVASGLAHEVAGKESEDEEAAAAKFDLGVFGFQYKGRTEAPSPYAARRNVRAKMSANEQRSMPAMTDTAPESQPGTEETTEGDQQQPVTPAAPEAPAAPADPAPVEPAAQASATGGYKFSLPDGRTTDNPAEMQQALNVLVAAQRQAEESARVSYVDALVNDNKLPATMRDSQVELVKGFSQAQYDSFKASWDGAPANPLFAAHGKPNSFDSPSQNASDDELQTHREIVAALKRGGMSDEKVAETESGKYVAQHDNQN